MFVISTHDVFLPIDHNEAGVLLLRSCQWNGNQIRDWEADLISEVDKIPNFVKKDILGSKRKILFAEGESQSLDRQIYQLIYPNVSVIPQGNCNQVEKAVEGVKGTESLHWISAFGLVDADDRTPEQLASLLEKGIAGLDCYSVESLYYDLEIVKRIAKRLAEITGSNENELYTKATSEIINSILPHKERLCSRLCEKHVRNNIISVLPKHKDIAKRGEFKYILNLNEVIEKEEAIFDKLISEANLIGLIRRYPVRETPVLTKIAAGLGLTRDNYESAVRKLIIDDFSTKQYLKLLLQKLTHLIDG